MDKNIELQEVNELQKRFQTSADELNQYFETLLGKIDDLNQLNSFQGKAADEIKRYFLEYMVLRLLDFKLQRKS